MKTLFALLATLLPREDSTRHAEEWHSDYLHAPELGIPRRHILLGAALTVLTSYITSPEVAPRRKTNYHLRMAFALLATCLMLCTTLVLLGFPQGPLSTLALPLLATAGITSASYQLAQAAKTPQTITYATTALTAAATILIGTQLSGSLIALVLLMLTGFTGLSSLITHPGSTTSPQRPLLTRPLTFSITLYLATALATSAAIYLLNPLLALPGKNLSQIYRDLIQDPAGYGSPTNLTISIISCLTFTLVPALITWFIGKQLLRTPQRALALTLLAPFTAVAATYSTSGFALGMHLADVFTISGSSTSPYLTLLALALALPALLGTFLFLVPRTPGQHPLQLVE